MSLTHQIRTLSERYFKSQSRIPEYPAAPDMRPFLAVPLDMRLVLLCLYDKRTMEEIKGVLPWAKETDVRLTSHRVRAAVQTLQLAMTEPDCWINPGELSGEAIHADLTDPDTPFPHISDTIPDDIERQFRQAYFIEVPLLLFGAHVPERVYALGLRKRVIVYLLVVEEMTQPQVSVLLGVSDRQIKNSLREMVEALS